ncbi:unnamed protein product, partial [Trichobilharzia regenti]
ANTNKLAKEADSEDSTPGEQREDASDEDNQPAPININEKDLTEFASYLLSSGQEAPFQPQAVGTDEDFKARQNRKKIRLHQTETSLKICTPQHEKQDLDFQHECEVNSATRVRNLH